MDPDANLAEQRRLTARYMQLEEKCDRCGTTPQDALELAELGLGLAELVIALDEWITKGGCLPLAWRNP